MLLFQLLYVSYYNSAGKLQELFKKKMLRVIYFCPSESMYGDNIALMRIMPYLVENGVKPYFVVSFEGKFTQYLKEHNYDYLVCHNRIWNLYNLDSPIRNFVIGGLWRLKHYVDNRMSVKRIASKLSTFNADLVHSNSSNSSFGYYLAKELSVKHIWHLREYGKLDANKQYFPCFKHFLYNKLDSVNNYTISITPLIHDYFHRKTNSITIYDGVVDEEHVPDICFKKEKYFLYVGRLFEKKGVEIIIDAFIEKAAVDAGYKLLIAGAGETEYETYLKNKVSHSKLDERILFLGYRQDVFDLMAKAKALIVASDFEGFGFITAEAMYAGCYVIGKNTAGTKLQFDNLNKKIGYEIGSRFMGKDALSCIMESIMAEKLDVKKSLSVVQTVVGELYGVKKSSSKVLEFYNKIR